MPDIEIDTTMPKTAEELEAEVDEAIAWLTSDEAKDFAHYTDDAGLTEAIIEGTEVRALCGHLFVPFRDPSKFPVCPSCVKIKDYMDRVADGMDV